MSERNPEWHAYSVRRFLRTQHYVACWCNGYEFMYAQAGKPRYFAEAADAEKFAEYLNLPETERQLIDDAEAYGAFYA